MNKILLAFLVAGHAVLGQTVLETNPTSLKWMQVNSPNFRVIFPEGFDFQAQRMASTLERIRTAESRTMGKEPRRISVILQNQSTISNGFVSMFPRRSEFFTMPAQNYNFTGSNDWLDLLASHEYRHVVQYRHATRGFNKMLYYLFGGPTLAGMAHAAAPDWFWEGDAVATETAFTPSGRGRIPHFNLVFRTNLVEGRKFNYHKQYLRSYRHNIPNHYVFGFNMVSYLRRRTNDPDIWEKITKRSWSVPFIPFAFSNAIRNKTGMSVTRLYREMANDLTDEWKNEIAQLTLTPFETVNQRPSQTWTDFLYPQPQPDGSVIVLKEGIGHIQQFVRINNGKEERLFTPGFTNDAGMLSTASGVIVWNEFGYDPRWPVRSYSLIKAYDWKKKSRVVVSDNNSRYGSAAISPDGMQIATVRTNEKYDHTLLILDYPSGAIRQEFPNPGNNFYAMPRWSDDGKKIVVIKLTGEGKTVSAINVQTGDATDLLPVSHENVGHPVLSGNMLLFSSPVSGIDNIYAINLETNQRLQVTSAKYGAYNPVVSPDRQYVYYNEQARNGMDVVRIPFKPLEWKAFAPSIAGPNLHEHLAEQEGEPDLFENIPQGNYPVKRFSKWTHVVNPFSWGLLLQNDLSRIDVGVTSQDILSTTSLNAGYTYDLAEQNGFWRAGLSYQGLFPIIDLTFTQGERSVDEELTTTVINGSVTTRNTDTYTFSWKEQNITGGLRIPLNLTRSKYSSGVEGAYEIGVTNVKEFDNGLNATRFFPAVIRDNVVEDQYFLIDYLPGGTFVYNRAAFSAFRYLKTSRRDIISRWGQSLDVEYYGTPFGGDFNGGLFSATGYLFFPGLFRHHSLYGHVAYQRTMLPKQVDERHYLFRNTIPIPRGINDYVSRHRQMTTASLNYTFPLWYPDIALGPVLNIQRVRVNLFGDVAMGVSTIFRDANTNYASVGAEVKFDLNIMRFLPQFDLGVRYSYGLEPSVTNFELVIGTFRL